ncbi:MAG: putative outer membrane protein [uncultured Paraburkholderia sp.]|nr:MAG: putative outer membrane protein [uncultured Paraburkholderia sp.]CAH2935060.1 MAG: putative outer membrane protein [uncultured Paraburkholderia sp.]
MNTRNIQTFLMVLAAFFAMSAPVRSNASTGAPSSAISRTALVAPARIAINRIGRESASRKEDQNS